MLALGQKQQDQQQQKELCATNLVGDEGEGHVQLDEITYDPVTNQVLKHDNVLSAVTQVKSEPLKDPRLHAIRSLENIKRHPGDLERVASCSSSKSRKILCLTATQRK